MLAFLRQSRTSIAVFLVGGVRRPAHILSLRRPNAADFQAERHAKLARVGGASCAAAWRGCFRASSDEIVKWCLRLENLGIAIEADFEWPGRSIYFRDPAGNSLEFAEPSIWGPA